MTQSRGLKILRLKNLEIFVAFLIFQDYKEWPCVNSLEMLKISKSFRDSKVLFEYDGAHDLLAFSPKCFQNFLTSSEHLRTRLQTLSQTNKSVRISHTLFHYTSILSPSIPFHSLETVIV